MKRLRFVAGVGFFALTQSLSVFFFTVPGPDQFFTNLLPLYFKSGFIDPEFSHRYALPGFFLLIRMFSEITGLSTQSLSPIYVLGVGSLIAIAIFLTARAKHVDAFWAVVVCSILSFVAIEFQFVSHFLGVALITLLLWREVAKDLTVGETALRIVLLMGLSVTHGYLGFYYVGYLLVRGLYQRSCLPRAALAFLIVLASDIFISAAGFFTSNVALVLYSIPALLGLAEYNLNVATTLISSSPFQPLSRISILGAAIIAATGLLVMIRRRILTSREHALIISGMLLFGAGLVVPLIGINSLQVDLLPAALGAGYLPLILTNRRVRALMLILLALSSIFPVMHFYYDPRIQTQDDVTAAVIASSTLNTKAQYGLYSPYMLRGYFLFLWPAYEAETRITSAVTDPIHDFIANHGSETDYIFLSYNVPVRQIDLAYQGYLVERANLVLNYGNGALYYWLE
jgi:hypothetical protein